MSEIIIIYIIMLCQFALSPQITSWKENQVCNCACIHTLTKKLWWQARKKSAKKEESKEEAKLSISEVIRIRMKGESNLQKSDKDLSAIIHSLQTDTRF